MAKSQLTSPQLRDGSGVRRADLDMTTTGSAVVARLVQGYGISLVSTGVDSGTGDVTIKNDLVDAGSPLTAFYLPVFDGSKLVDSVVYQDAATGVAALTVLTPGGVVAIGDVFSSSGFTTLIVDDQSSIISGTATTYAFYIQSHGAFEVHNGPFSIIDSAATTHALLANGSYNSTPGGGSALVSWDTLGNIISTSINCSAESGVSFGSLASNATDMGFFVLNTNTASSGNQQYSPAISWTGIGWKTSTGGGGRPVTFRSYVMPVQGVSVPSGTWVLESNINNVGYIFRFSVDSAGLATAATFFGTTSLTTPLIAGSGSTDLSFTSPSNKNFVFTPGGTGYSVFNGAGSAGPVMQIIGQNDGSFNSVLDMTCPTLTTGHEAQFTVGRNPASRNRAYFGFYYDSNDSANNRAVFGFYGFDRVVSIYPAGSLYVGSSGAADPGAGAIQSFGNLLVGSKLTKYNGVVTQGYGAPIIYKVGRSLAQSAAVASVAAYTNAATDGSFEVSANVLVTTSALAYSFTVTVAYTDEGNTARTLTLNFSSLAGVIATTVTNAAGAVPFVGIPIHIRCKASTAITIATVGTFTGATYNVEGIIRQLA